MERPEQFKSRREWENFIWDKIVDSLAETSSKDGVEEILHNLLGDYDKKLMLRRLTAILLIKDNLSYSQISKILWISPSTIAAIKKGLANKAGYASRKKLPAALYSSITMPKKKTFAGEKFIDNLLEYLLDIHRSYANPKYRWNFLHQRKQS